MILKNGLVVTMNSEFEVFKGDIRIQGDSIAELGNLNALPGEELIDLNGKVVIPGLIQTHVHLCQTIFRNRAEDRPLLKWLKEKIWVMEAGLIPETIRISADLGIAELLKGGTTAVLTMETVRHTEVVLEVVKQGGIRAVVGKALMDRNDRGHPVELSQTIEESVREVEQLCREWQGAEKGRVGIGLAPRFMLSVSHELFDKVLELSEEKGLLIHTHAAESKEETELVRRETGMGNIEYFHQLGMLSPKFCVAHCIWVDKREMDLLAWSGSHVLHCPTANMKLGSGMAPIAEMRDKGVAVSLGADGAACNNTLDMFQEMRLAGLIQKVRIGAEALPAKEIFTMATMGGARALGQEDKIGSIEVGKKADIVVLDLDKPHAVPEGQDIYTRIVYSVRVDDVDSVWVDGKWVVKGGKLMTLDEADVVEKAKRVKI
jgi:5-methylthioadenosine/S-adenosylhomocysteine deaminase